MSIEARLATAAFDPGAELAEFIAGADGAGAVASFTGLVRDRGHADMPVVNLFLDHHPRLTERSLTDIASAAHKRFHLLAVRVVHRCGNLLPHDPIVFVAAAAHYRDGAIPAVAYLMDRLKTEAVFWKREDRVDGALWIEPHDMDYQARARWGVD